MNVTKLPRLTRACLRKVMWSEQAAEEHTAQYDSSMYETQ